MTQSPTDVPSSVLSQLGNRVQHALRAFTPEDADNLRKTARTFPMTEFYDVEKLLTSLGIGEAAVTVLSPRGVPTPLAATRLIAPDSQMSPIPDDQFAALVAASPLQAKYGATVDRASAYEMIKARIDAAQLPPQQAAAAQQAAAQAAAPTYAAPGTAYGTPTPGAAPGTVTMTQAELRRAQQQARATRATRKRKRSASARHRLPRPRRLPRTRRVPNATGSGRSTARSAPASTWPRRAWARTSSAECSEPSSAARSSAAPPARRYSITRSLGRSGSGG